MNCADLTKRFLSKLLLNQLTCEERQGLDEHLAACDKCRAEVQAWNRLESILRLGEPPEVEAKPEPSMADLSDMERRKIKDTADVAAASVAVISAPAEARHGIPMSIMSVTRTPECETIRIRPVCPPMRITHRTALAARSAKTGPGQQGEARIVQRGRKRGPRVIFVPLREGLYSLTVTEVAKWVSSVSVTMPADITPLLAGKGTWVFKCEVKEEGDALKLMREGFEVALRRETGET